jgi:hypothetical protein
MPSQNFMLLWLLGVGVIAVVGGILASLWNIVKGKLQAWGKSKGIEILGDEDGKEGK